MVSIDGKKVRRLRKQRYLSHRDLARMAGLSTTTVQNVEASRGVRGSTVRRLAEALGVAPDEIATSVDGEE